MPARDPRALVHATGLRKHYRSRAVLDGVDVTLDAGTVTLLTGANGAGKTTLLRILATLDAPDAGRLRVAGVDAGRDGARARRAVAWVGHAPGLYPTLTVKENLAFHLRFHGDDDADTRLGELMARFNLDAVADARAARLSRGTLQRAALARAFAQRARVIILDEPWTGLDAGSRDALAAAIADAQDRGAAVIASTHDAAAAQALSPRVLHLAEGRVTERDGA